MTNLQRYEYFVLRYVADLVKNEPINFGLVVMDASREGALPAFTEVRLTSDWRRIKCMDANADLEMLEALSEDIRRKLATARDREEMLGIMESFSNTVQVSDVKPLMTLSPASDTDRLAFELLESPQQKSEKTGIARGRMAVYAPMRDEFARAGVWPLMKKDIRAALYTHPGDPLKIDCGYQPNSTRKMFHAVSLKTDLNFAKVLAFTYPRIVEGMMRAENAEARLTAIVENDLDRKSDSILFALDAFEQARIAVATVSQVAQLAEVARKELRV